MDPSESLPARLGIVGGLGEDGLEHVRLAPFPELVHGGVVRISVLTLMADMLGGWVATQYADRDWVFTTDLSVRAPETRVPKQIVATAKPQRVGKKNVAAEVWMHDERGALFAYSHIGFVRMARRPGDNPNPDFALAAAQWGSRPRIEQPLTVAAGIEVVDAATGTVEVELRDVLRNPAGAMQGAMVALVGEVAAETLATHHLGAPQVVTDIDVRYLAMGRTGPVRARAAFVGDPRHGAISVELRDLGHDSRLMTALLVRTAPAEAPNGRT
jgi:acyl-coenzyme A thioesterase PaaI-like protein